MIVSREISTDIIVYLREKKEMPIADIAKTMDTSPNFIQFVINEKLILTTEHINTYLKNTNTHFWEFALEAIPLNHMSKKAKNRVLLCKRMAEYTNKKENEENP